mgnify:CR=1 FL=1
MEDYRRRPFEKVVRHQVGVRRRSLQVSPRGNLVPRWKTPLSGLALAFLTSILMGTLLLMLPVSSSNGLTTNFLDALFTSTSATLVTGLIVVDTSEHWSNFGQFIILLLIQIGGLGYVTGLAVILIASGRKVSLNQRKSLRLVFGGGRLGRIDLEAKNILLYSIVIQLIGAVLLSLYFVFDGLNITESSWHGMFHAISAFQNAGFDITSGNSISIHRSNGFIVTTITLLSFLGATGFNALFALIIIRKWRPLNLDLKLVIWGSFIVAVIGFLGILLSEWSNPLTFANMPLSQKLLDSFSLAIGGRTSGFTTIPMAELRDYTLFLLACLMAIGGAAGSMTGGIKLGVFMIMIFTIWSTVKGQVGTVAFRKEIPDPQVRRAFSIVALAFLYINLSSLLLSLLEEQPFIEILFEVVSAFGLVGLSTGITPELSSLGKILLIVSMFIGRLLPIYIALELARRERKPLYRFPQEDVRIG